MSNQLKKKDLKIENSNIVFKKDFTYTVILFDERKILFELLKILNLIALDGESDYWTF